MEIKRGLIYWIDLNPSIGHEINKNRPCLVISNDTNNEFSETVTIIPITSNVSKIYPFEVLIMLEKECKIKTDQIRTVDKARIKQFIAELPKDKIKEVEKALLIHLGL